MLFKKAFFFLNRFSKKDMCPWLGDLLSPNDNICNSLIISCLDILYIIYMHLGVYILYHYINYIFVYLFNNAYINIIYITLKCIIIYLIMSYPDIYMTIYIYM